MNIERIFPSGGWLVSDIIGGFLVSRRYLASTKRESVRQFRDEFRKGSPRIPRNEIVNGHPIRCFDFGPYTGDRFTVCYMDSPERKGMIECLGMNSHPFHPSHGIGQHSSAMVGRHLGKRIRFADLPPDCQRAVLQDLTPAA